MNRTLKAGTGHFTISTSDSTSLISSFTSTAAAGEAQGLTVPVHKAKKIDVESAVYAHIQAIRALGKTKVSPEEIARALDLPVSAVERSLSGLSHKGVKVVHHG